MRFLESSIGILGLILVGLSNLSAQTWELFQKSNSPLPSDSIRSIATESASRAWIGTEKGLAQYNNNQWTNYNQANSPLPNNEIQTLALNGSEVWIGTKSGLAKLSNGNWNVYQAGTSQLPDNDVEDLAMDNSGNLWIATYGGGVAQFDDSLNNWTIHDTPSSTLRTNLIQAVDVSRFGNIWIGTALDGAYKYDFLNWSNYKKSNSGIAANFPSSMATDQSKVWFGFNGNGLSAFNLSNSSWQNYSAASSGLPNNYVTDIAIGLANAKWVGTRFGGVGRLDSGGTWTTYDSNNTILPSQTVLAVESDPKGNQWFGTDQGIVFTGCVPKFDSISVTSCKNYLSPDSNELWTNSGIYIDTVPTPNNCDSIITVNLTINSVDTGVNRNGIMLESVENNAGYQWLDCNNGYAELGGDTSQTFIPASTGSYALEVTKNGCVDTSTCHNIQGNTLKGTVTYQGNQLDTGEVFLYEVSSNNYNKVDSLFIGNASNGRYQFNNVDTGQYLVKAYPDSNSSVANSAVPTYYDSAVIWNNATKVSISSNQIYTADIYLKEPKKQQGPGTISGTIVESGPQKRKGPGDPQGGIEILALTGGGDVQDYDVSAKDGTYEFNNMSLDTHRVLVEITGFTARDEKVTLTQDNQTADSMIFEIDKDEDSVYVFVPEIRESAQSFEAYRVYPNPAKDRVNIVLKVRESKNLSIKLSNALGQKVKERSWSVRSGANKHRIKVNDLARGFYFLGIEGEKGRIVQVKKIVIR